VRRSFHGLIDQQRDALIWRQLDEAIDTSE